MRARPCIALAGVDLTTIEGIAEGTALVILAEIGTDMRRWPTVKHFCRWLGLSPPHKMPGGKARSRGPPPRGVHGPPRTALGAFFRRLRSRLGASKAITTTAHKLARLVDSLLST